MSTRFWATYLGVALFTVVCIAQLGDSNHRATFAQSLDQETGGSDALYFTAVGFEDETLAVFPADNSPVHCDEIADWLALGDGAPGLVHEGFTSVQCGTHKEKIETNVHPSDDGTGAKENEPFG